jgi:hypothetical protein
LTVQQDQEAKGKVMKFQIWCVPVSEHMIYSEALTQSEAEALEEFGYTLEHEFEAVSSANAEAYYVGWCDMRDAG